MVEVTFYLCVLREGKRRKSKRKRIFITLMQVPGFWMQCRMGSKAAVKGANSPPRVLADVENAASFEHCRGGQAAAEPVSSLYARLLLVCVKTDFR